MERRRKVRGNQNDGLRGEFLHAEFTVPDAEASSLSSGQWIWEMCGWRGIKSCALGRVPGDRGYLTVTATKTAMTRVRRFCTERNYKERTA